MIGDPSRSTVVAWYETLPEELALLVERVQVGAGRLLGDTFTPRDPRRCRHADRPRKRPPFDHAPLVAHLRKALSPPWTIRFGGFAPATGGGSAASCRCTSGCVGVYGRQQSS
jgi:hypothetical protein